jgi:hypothetical protein
MYLFSPDGRSTERGRLWGDVGAGDCDLPDGENDFLNLRI